MKDFSILFWIFYLIIYIFILFHMRDMLWTWCSLPHWLLPFWLQYPLLLYFGGIYYLVQFGTFEYVYRSSSNDWETFHLLFSIQVYLFFCLFPLLWLFLWSKGCSSWDVGKAYALNGAIVSFISSIPSVSQAFQG